ncbi:MAG TPA: hypothetical protein VFN67_18320 [Polyangiales bacterium]|nr:hypothetical protein [Polyangiales bacterium]
MSAPTRLAHSLLHQLSLLFACAVLATSGSACGRPRHAGDVPNTPQAALEAALIRNKHRGTRRTGDGGIIYVAELTPSSPEVLRVPYDLLKLECENHSGRFGHVAPPAKPAASLATDDAPDAIHAMLVEADNRQLFGQQRCEAGSNVWIAEIEPHAFKTGRGFSLQIYVRASPAEGYDPGAPIGPGFPALGEVNAAGEAAPPPPPPAAAPAPLDQQPARPPLSGERLLADPRPYGLTPGVDSPAILAKKLGVELSAATACDQPNLKGFCWDKPSSEALQLRAAFVDLGMGPVLAELDVRYPTTAHAWLARMFQSQFGPADDANAQQSSWDWLHTRVQLASSEHETRVYVAHKPTLDRAQLPSGSPGREASPAARGATPWQLQIGYETAQSAQAKLQAAGFSIPKTGCADGGSYAQPVFTRTCPLSGGRMQGSRGAWVRTVDIGDGKPRLAELGYTLDKSALADTTRDLKEQYGEPIPSSGGQLQWWTGSVGITLTPSADGFTLRYYHGRLLQYFIVAEAKRQTVDKAVQRQGL